MMTGNGYHARLIQEKGSYIRTAKYRIRVLAVQSRKPLSKSAPQNIFDRAARILEYVIVEQHKPDRRQRKDVFSESCIIFPPLRHVNEFISVKLRAEF